MRGKGLKNHLFGLGFVLSFVSLSIARADNLTVYGGPTYNSATGTGYWASTGLLPVVGNGIAACAVEKFTPNGDLGQRAVRWGASGAVTELGTLGTSDGYTEIRVSAINDSGDVVGTALADGVEKGFRAVRWYSSATAATELGSIGVYNTGIESAAVAINNNGIVTGNSQIFDTVGYQGFRAVRWDTSGEATELQVIGTNNSGQQGAYGQAINDAGTVVGIYETPGTPAPARWDASGTAITALDGYNVAFSAINDNDIAVGVDGFNAMRWNASGMEEPLGNLGVGGTSNQSYASAINNSGIAVGWSTKLGLFKNNVAVRWDASGTAATELGNIGTDNNGNTISQAFGINNSGLVVGFAEKYDSLGNDLGERAVMWGPDGIAINLNSLIDPASGWVLMAASSIDGDWIAGIGTFDPDGPGPLPAYNRMFLIEVPEPSSLGLLALMLTFSLKRSGRSLMP